ncbi:DAK2 domain-containing protein [Eubacterium sp. am_0171]|uniref:Dihydroxyacetone kinase n=1 Tax=Faecalicatena contorta TaxID=39482 RepID=A0A174FF19_9FIRM|nr:MULTISPECIES: DAK2 domain-containing protein [Clostridia]MDU7708415.1 DAK2 domain-containing protein [Clostridium sp.]MSC82615.1 DAK2 domain-containing protein [Eubacterium sp. BIOML-A1]MSD04872.1 DAK2 domain-containing protein [Eubacterium sp. BIOML-A2]RYT25337.1 DAK2 domain-containing protein [Eubacterium sp. am_0171]CUO48783.1 dihydroxyacetone kinase [[Eubacterium] contortum] [Faecalicatena contorta]
MATKTINTELLTRMFLAGAANLEAKKEFINELNVFPVPDGDTGTNMTLTIMSAAKEVSALEQPDMLSVSKAISSGSLRGARGNSGVILSQLLRGFTKEIREYKEIDVQVLAQACDRARATAYKAVMKPKEGTILTVAKGIAQKAAEMAETTDDLEVFIPEVLKHAEYVLSKTPDMLPVLKDAGVVDSGGQGLVEVLNGAYDAFQGKEIDYSAIEASSGTSMVRPGAQAEADIKFGYCTEFIIMTSKPFSETNETEFKAYLESIGDSIVCVADEDIVKIHVHTNDPGLAIQKALTYGQLSRMKIDNMREEHQEKLIKDAEKQAAEQKKAVKKPETRKKVGFIAVSIGEGMNEIFRELGVDYIIEGGQTMNPSTEDMLTAIDAVNADHIFILPNNKNIILAANQAQSLTKDKDILVIPTKTVPQGITAVINYMPEADIDTNAENMNEEIKNVKSGQITYAVRDTHIDDKEIHEGDIMGIGDAGILAVGQSVEGVAKEMLTSLVDEDTELISLYYGQDVLEADAVRFAQEIEELYPDADVDAHFGGQPIYYYVLSVE